MRRLHDEVVGGEDELLQGIVREREETLRFLLVVIERLEVRGHVGLLEVVRRPLPFLALRDLAVGDARRPRDLVDRVDVLQVHADALETVRELARDRTAVDAADLLEIGELADLETVEPHLPTETPRSERR